MLVAWLASPAGAQEGVHPRTAKGVLGYLDPATGAFRPVTHSAPDSDTTAATTGPSYGKLVFNFTITIQSSIPTSSPITCTAIAETIETNTTTYQEKTFMEDATVPATRSGSTATCSVPVPYSWNLSTPASDAMDLSFYVEAGSSASASRLSEQSLTTIKIPGNGATTTEAVKVTL
jgi:hypothetical protein